MTDNKAKILWESKGNTPAGDPFSTVKEARGYYSYLERGGKDSIAFILFDKSTKKFALIKESKPPMDETMNEEVKMITAFGGSIDMNKSYKEICQTEVKEEAGYIVPLDKIYSVGKTLVSSQMSQMCEGFLVDVTGINKTEQAEYELEATADQTAKDENECVGNSVEWLDADGLMENNCWKSIWIFTKAVYSDIIVKG